MTKSAPKPQPKPGDIVCPYCGADPMEIRYKSIMSPEGLVMLGVSCGNIECRKAIGFSFQASVDTGSRIHMPGKA